MRTTDFSKAPKQARGEVLLIIESVIQTAAVVETAGAAATETADAVAAEGAGATASHTARPTHRARGAHSARSARSVARQATAAPGYVWHKTFRHPARGVIVFFVQRPAAEQFRATLDRASWRVRLLVAESSGYSNGVWRAEGNVMAHIEHFSPTSVEAARGSTPPLVAGSPPHRAGDSGRSAAAAPTPSRASKAPPQPSDTPAANPGGSVAATPTPSRNSTAPPGEGGGGAARSVTDARAMFVGATKYRGPRALLTLSRTWYPMIARMQKLHGYVWHTVYWQPPFTLGTLAFFATRDDLLSFARLPAHRQLMQWITRDTKNGTGGYIRLHTAPDPPVDGSAAAMREADTRSADHHTLLAVSDSTTDPDTIATTSTSATTSASATTAGTRTEHPS